MIYLTDNIDEEAVELVNNLREVQKVQTNVLTEVKLLHFTGREFNHDDAPTLLDLIRMYCSEFNASSVYIFGEKSHCAEMISVFKSNPNYIKSNSLIKFLAKNGTPIILKED